MFEGVLLLFIMAYQAMFRNINFGPPCMVLPVACMKVAATWLNARCKEDRVCVRISFCGTYNRVAVLCTVKNHAAPSPYERTASRCLLRQCANSAWAVIMLAGVETYEKEI